MAFEPTQVGSASNWTAIAAGSGHTIALRNDATLWTWGRNQKAQLGDGTLTGRTNLLRITDNWTWTAVAAGDRHTVAIRTDGTLWAWGDNSYGQLGDGTLTNRNLPVQVGTRTDWKSVAAGNYESFGITEDGALWVWGWTWRGLGLSPELGLPPNLDFVLAPMQVEASQGWQSVASGSLLGSHTLALDENGVLWGWGDNDYGELGLEEPPFHQVSGGPVWGPSQP